MKSRIHLIFFFAAVICGCKKQEDDRFVHRSPVANAGADIIVLLPANEANLAGIIYDENGDVQSHKWTMISGPNTSTVENPVSLNTRVSNLVEGIYLFELKVTDKRGAHGFDYVEVRVMNDWDPVANAGNDTTIRLPYSNALLKATVIDNNFDTAIYRWSKIAGPAQFNLDPYAPGITRVTNLIEGTYQFEVTVTDLVGNIGRDTMSISVRPDQHIYSKDTILVPTSLLCPFGCTGAVINNIFSIVPQGQPFTVYMNASTGWMIVPPDSLGNNYPDFWMFYETTYSIENGNLNISSDADFTGGVLFKIVY